VCQSRLSHPRAGVMKSWVGLAFHRPLGVAAARAVKANFSACRRDAQLGRQRLHRGVALIAVFVQNQKIIRCRFCSRCKLNYTAPRWERLRTRSSTHGVNNSRPSPAEARPGSTPPLVPRRPAVLISASATGPPAEVGGGLGPFRAA